MSLNCDLVMDLVSLYHDGSVSNTTRTAVEEHLKTCAECRSFYHQYRHLIGRQPKYQAIDIPDIEAKYNKLADKMYRRRNTLTLSLALYTSLAALSVLLILLNKSKQSSAK